MLIGNGLMIYRVWDMIPNGHWIIVFLTALLSSACVLDFFVTSRLARQGANLYSVQYLSYPLFTIPLILNICISSLILLRIHQAERMASTRDGMHKLSCLRRLIITSFETGIIMPATLLILLALYYTRKDVDVILVPIIQVIGITPTIMWIQARLGLTRYDAAIEHYAFTVSRDMQFATPERYPARPSHRPLECLFSQMRPEEDRIKDELRSPVGSLESFSIRTQKPQQCIPRGRPWQSSSVEQMHGPERREHPSSFR